MAYPLFQLPKHWTEWVLIGVCSVEICVKRGMTQQAAQEYLLGQNPEKIVQFVNKFYNPFIRKEINIEYPLCPYGNLDEGCRIIARAKPYG